MMNQHPALKHAPKSKKEAGQRLIDAYLSGKLQVQENCAYQDPTGKPCAIGFFFTEAQIKWIKQRRLVSVGMNKAAVRMLARYIGEENLKAMTRLSVDEAERVQQAFDNEQADRFVARVREITGA